MREGEGGRRYVRGVETLESEPSGAERVYVVVGVVVETNHKPGPKSNDFSANHFSSSLRLIHALIISL